MGRAEREEREPKHWSEGSTRLLLETTFEPLLKFIKTGFYSNQLFTLSLLWNLFIPQSLNLGKLRTRLAKVTSSTRSHHVLTPWDIQAGAAGRARLPPKPCRGAGLCHGDPQCWTGLVWAPVNGMNVGKSGHKSTEWSICESGNHLGWLRPHSSCNKPLESPICSLKSSWCTQELCWYWSRKQILCVFKCRLTASLGHNFPLGMKEIPAPFEPFLLLRSLLVLQILHVTL